MPKQPKKLSPEEAASADVAAKKEAKRLRKEERLRAAAVEPDSERPDTPPLTQPLAEAKVETEEQKAAKRERARKWAEERNRIHHVIVEALRPEYGAKGMHRLQDWNIIRMWPSMAEVPNEKRDLVKRVLNEPHMTAFDHSWFELRKWYEHFEGHRPCDSDMEDD